MLARHRLLRTGLVLALGAAISVFLGGCASTPPRVKAERPTHQKTSWAVGAYLITLSTLPSSYRPPPPSASDSFQPPPSELALDADGTVFRTSSAGSTVELLAHRESATRDVAQLDCAVGKPAIRLTYAGPDHIVAVCVSDPASMQTSAYLVNVSTGNSVLLWRAFGGKNRYAKGYMYFAAYESAAPNALPVTTGVVDVATGAKSPAPSALATGNWVLASDGTLYAWSGGDLFAINGASQTDLGAVERMPVAVAPGGSEAWAESPLGITWERTGTRESYTVPRAGVVLDAGQGWGIVFFGQDYGQIKVVFPNRRKSSPPVASLDPQEAWATPDGLVFVSPSGYQQVTVTRK